MAKQKGIIKLEGTLGDITFLKSKDGYIARQKGGVSAERIATDPAFQRTRENGAEFGRAGKAGKLLRTAFRTLLQTVSDSRMVSRLNREMVRVIQADTTNARGQRNVIDGEAELLEGFDFNAAAQLNTTLYAPYTVSLNRETGACAVSVPSFIPATMVLAPSGATHFRMRAAAAEIDFEQEIFISKEEETLLLPWNEQATGTLSLALTLTPGSTHPLFLALGIEFTQEVNGIAYPLKNGAYNALTLVKVDGSA